MSSATYVPYGDQLVPLPGGDSCETCEYCRGEYLPSESHAEGFCTEACALTSALDVRGVLLQQVKLHILYKNERAAAFTAQALVGFCRAWEASDIREALL